MDGTGQSAYSDECYVRLVPKPSSPNGVIPMRVIPFVIAALGVALSSMAVFAVTPITPVPRQASLRVAAVQVRVVLDHRDWTYELGQPAKFTVFVTADNQPIDNVSVSYSVGREMTRITERMAVVPIGGLMIDGGSLSEPGFLRCTVSCEVAGKTYKGVATAAYAPDSIRPLQVEPADFDDFWRNQLSELSKAPLQPSLTYLPESSTDTVDVYHVSFRTVGPGWTTVPARIFGILCEPKLAGKYPVILKVPGAGVRAYMGDKELASRGAITLEIGVHGIPVNLPDSVYDSLYAGALNGYWAYNFDNKETFYYRRIYLSCVRANDFLASRPMWDGKNMLVMGASQGGQLSIVTAALDSRVTGLAATHPAFCDVAAELHGRAGGWPHPFQANRATGEKSEHATAEKIATSTYYDTVNFARRLKVPGYYTWGYNDEVCPPTSTYAAYNVITAPKTLGLTLELAHSYNQEQHEAITEWTALFLGLK